MEVFEAWWYRPTGQLVVRLLRDPDATMRQWAATLLRLLDLDPAVPDLTALAARLRADGISPGDTERVAVSWSRTALGARQPVLPEVVSPLVEHRPTGDVWPAARLEELLRALAAAGQLILGFQLWRRHERFGLTWERHESLGCEFDRAATWSDNGQPPCSPLTARPMRLLKTATTWW